MENEYQPLVFIFSHLKNPYALDCYICILVQTNRRPFSMRGDYLKPICGSSCLFLQSQFQWVPKKNKIKLRVEEQKLYGEVRSRWILRILFRRMMTKCSFSMRGDYLMPICGSLLLFLQYKPLLFTFHRRPSSRPVESNMKLSFIHKSFLLKTLRIIRGIINTFQYSLF